MTTDFKDAKEALAQIEAGIANLATTEGWHDYLKAATKFHNYSLNNLMLIAMQYPEASQVAGYKTWQALGRQVRKGETGIRILAPMVGKVKDENGEPTEKTRVFGFKTVPVFDVAQTDGDEIVSPVTLLEGEAPEGIFERLVEFAESIGFTTEIKGDGLGGANGTTNFDTNTISILGTNSPLQQVKTMAHEIGHALLHTDREAKIGRDQKELEAESVAFVVCQALGVKSDDYTFGYVLTWKGGDAEAIKGLRESASRIVKAADQVIAALEVTSEEEVAVAA